MDSLHTGSDELLYIETESVRVTIKGKASHPAFQGVELPAEKSSVRILCDDTYHIAFKGQNAAGEPTGNAVPSHSGLYQVQPMFFEQQGYEIIIELIDHNHTVSFWHENLNVRKKVSPVGRSKSILSGIINFGNEIGFSDLIIRLDGHDYLLLRVEVFPTKISYQEDYLALIEDVTREVYNLIFDFLKKTYLSYRQKDHVGSSPVEFFAVIQKIYDDFVKAADIILAHPHHQLEVTHQVLPAHKVRQIDSKSRHWIQNHPNQVNRKNDRILVAKIMTARKQVTYDTRENRLAKYILQSTIKKLGSFKRIYTKMYRAQDPEIISRIDSMIHGLNRRCSSTPLSQLSAQAPDAGVSMVFSMAPGYRDLYRYYLMLLRGLSITGEIFNISVKNLAELYEYWCFIKLNTLMKERYELVSQDIIKVHGNGLFVSLVKGQRSRVEYRNPRNGEHIMLSYNPEKDSLPTVAQKPDNVLTLEKHGAVHQYEYVFDAKYRIDPALPGTDYHKTSGIPGPKEDDINTMHRYRDAIVYDNGASVYERTMLGAYVLFPYHDEKRYRNHRFYKSIETVNIGGLPFLPSATTLVAKMLDTLVADSPESAFERATLPKGTEEKLAKVDWTVRDVLVGPLRLKDQLDICLNHRFYHIPARQVESHLPIRYVALSQSKKLFGADAGVRYYGEVVHCIPVKRREIYELPKDSDEPYYRLEVKEWKKLTKAIEQKEIGLRHVLFTNYFLLTHSADVPELRIQSDAEYRLFAELKRAVNHPSINDNDEAHSIRFENNLVTMEEGKIRIYTAQKCVAEYEISEFEHRPTAIFKQIRDILAVKKTLEA